MTGGQIRFLLQDVLVFGALAGVLDLPDPGPLGRVRDVLRLLLPDVARGLIGAHRRADQRHRPLHAGGQQHRGQERRIHQRARPLADPQHRVVGGVRAQMRPGLGNSDRAGSKNSRLYSRSMTSVTLSPFPTQTLIPSETVIPRRSPHRVNESGKLHSSLPSGSPTTRSA